MAIQSKRLRRRLFRILPVLAALVVLLISLILVSDVHQETSGYNRTYIWVLVLTIIALVILSIAIIARVFSLYKQVRTEAPGARLSSRWVRNFLALSLPPALIVYVFSAYFLTRTVDNWFSVEVESALADSLQLGQEFLDRRTLEVRNQMRRISRGIDSDSERDEIRSYLLSSVSASGPVELTLLDNRGRTLTTASYAATANLPERPGDYALLQAVERGEYAAAEPSGDGSLFIRVLQRLPTTTPGLSNNVLQAIYPLPTSITDLTRSIEQEYYRYQNVSYLRSSLKQSFLLILSLVLLLTVLVAILAALAAARRMVAPISGLAQATRRVAAGDLDQAVETGSRDEIGFLAQSFNEMTEALLNASNEAERSRASLQAQGEYLETVLGSLSTGVITLDAGGVIIRINPAAEKILGLPADLTVGSTLSSLKIGTPALEPLSTAINRYAERGRTDWQQEIQIQTQPSPLVLLVRGSELPVVDQQPAGQVVVFDDVTVLNQAQRDAAWAEVARRMAHEVKNPLTPIRLAAERLRMKLMDRLNARDAEMLDKSATTIVAQVEALRTLVDAFGDYAREPQMDRAVLHLDKLVDEVVELYRQASPDMNIELELCQGPDGLMADAGQIRQLLHNVIRNANEAAEPGSAAKINISTATILRNGLSWLELLVTDDGPGFPDAVLSKPFEPYVTSKPNGSGLGLAICRKIVVDHNGTIEISNLEAGGACCIVRLPLRSGELDVQPTMVVGK